MEAPSLSSSRSLKVPSHGLAQSAQPPQDAAAMPRTALSLSGKHEECRTVLRAMYKQQCTRTGAR